MDDERSPEKILNMIGDTKARTVLAAVIQKPRSVNELEERLDLSQASVYRQVNKLHEYDLIAERTLVADDGNHYSEYKCNFKSVIMSVEEDRYDVRIF